MYLNKVLLVGNLTRDPEKKALPSGTSVTTFGIATNRVWNDQSGQRQEQADYHNIVVFGKQAETSAQYLKKGQSVLIEGRIQTRSWDADDGTKRYRTEIVADRVQFGPKSGGAPMAAGDNSSAEANQGEAKEDVPEIEYPEEEINPEDIPF